MIKDSAKKRKSEAMLKIKIALLFGHGRAALPKTSKTGDKGIWKLNRVA